MVTQGAARLSRNHLPQIIGEGAFDALDNSRL
jgi:hypothetical protein